MISKINKYKTNKYNNQKIYSSILLFNNNHLKILILIKIKFQVVEVMIYKMDKLIKIKLM